MRKWDFPAYQGKKPYIFVSYSFKNEKKVYPVIKDFRDRGYRVWFDEELSPGSGREEGIADALSSCTMFLLLLTPDAAESEKVQNEVNYAVDEKKPFLAIHLEETTLRGGMKLQIGTRQAILRYNMTDEEYVYKYTSAFERMGVISVPPKEILREEEWLREHPEDRRRTGSGRKLEPVSDSGKDSKSGTRMILILAAVICAAAAGIFFLRGRAGTGVDPGTAEIKEEETGKGEAVWFTYTKYTRHVEITGWKSASGKLEIPSEIEGLPVTAIRQENQDLSASAAKQASSIIVPEGVVTIGDSAFYGLTGTEKIELPESVTEIGDYAFAECKVLTELKLPAGIRTIGEHAFEFCVSLKEMDLPDEITEIPLNAFMGCNALENVSFPDHLKRIGQMAFYGCVNLKDIILPDTLTMLETNVFGGCVSLETVRLSSGMTEIPEGTFFYSSIKDTLVIPSEITGIRLRAFSSASVAAIEYGGTEDQWNKIEIESGNDTLKLANMVFSGK